ncbi:MAG: hypothetical protein A2275_03490 [Bacteroidetes bacterium RIFOXYA12_FULL_35_11]|nr:MAG: hypothetical protein A2X01_05550 [Bacteroidetes bacterium GWF2_35_48]OFY81963.1 MAG: hypothetical protein A2275_03490 [Bacteroidetes bacterium RIFOXYA12_FULL_35_11]OFY96279.1 MAG: hypothetical protein A2309_12930 [Bacteroidetes bacterium RIFOXYB2_FULL_35_7]OFZ05917.1 MAG: hypothetical protein A2491_16435 [Bacteroidetes bacterium RIFOXYC12_FULL_35_7]
MKTDEDKAVELMFTSYYGVLCKRVNRIINNTIVSEDIVQDVFYNFWEKKSRLNIELSIGAYLNRMALNAALTFIRKVKKISLCELNESLAYEKEVSNIEREEEALSFRKLQEKVQGLIESLPPKCKIIFTMSRFEEMTNKQIADHLSISVKTVENQMTKALRVFRNNLVKEY